MRASQPATSAEERSPVMEQKAIPMEALVPVLQLQMAHGGEAAVTVTGTSMLPMLTPIRDKVWLRSCCDQLQCGDVILYRRENGQYVLHRIVKLSQPMICCGDNQWQKEYVQQSQVIAVVTSFYRRGKRYTTNAWTYRLYTWLMIALLPARRHYIAIRRRLGKLRRALRNMNKLFLF